MFDNGDAYIDYLAHGSDSINTAVELLLPFHNTILHYSKFYAFWLGLIGVGLIALMAAARVTQPIEIWKRILLVVTFMIILIPINVTPNQSGRSYPLGLGPFVLWKAIGGFDQVFRGGVDKVLESMAGESSKLPLHFYETLSSTFSEKLGNSPATRIYNDYMYRCTRAVDPSVAGYPTWYRLGLMGGGGLGLPLEKSNMSDQHSSPTSSFWTWLITRMTPGTYLVNSVYQSHKKGNIIDQIEDELPSALAALRSIDFGGDLHKRNGAYLVPSAAYWRAALNVSAPTTNEVHFIPVTDRYLPYHEKEAIRMGDLAPQISELKEGEDRYLHYVQNCEQLYELANTAMAQFYAAVKDYYEIGKVNYNTDPEQVRNASISTVKAATEHLYRTSGAIKSLKAQGDIMLVPGLDTKDKGVLDKAEDTVKTEASSISSSFFNFLQELNLDKLIPVVIGGISLGIAFIIVFSPIPLLFALILPDRGAVIWTIAKITLLLQLTLMFSYIIVKVGLILISVINELNVVAAAGPLGTSRVLANMTLAVTSFAFMATILAGYFAKAIVFSGQGIGSPGGDPAPATKQMATTLGAIYAASSIAMPLLRAGAAKNAAGAGRGLGNNGSPTPNQTPTPSPAPNVDNGLVVSQASAARSAASTASFRYDGKTGSEVSVAHSYKPASQDVSSTSWTYGHSGVGGKGYELPPPPKS